MDVHVCPILMRTVRFLDGNCSENCNESDCPILEELKRELEDDPVKNRA